MREPLRTALGYTLSMERTAQNHDRTFDDAPIGLFDSGYGGLTVLREVAALLPEESIVFIGDSARCPYGPRDQADVDRFVQQICRHLVDAGCKLIVIACNTATAAGLVHAQQTFDVPIVGVVEPGARAAAHTTRNRRVGVIATQGTIDSGVYTAAIKHMDAGMSVFPLATPRFVDIVEHGLRLSAGDAAAPGVDIADVFMQPTFEQVARECLEPLQSSGIDTLVLGCTHFPLLREVIAQVMGPEVTLVSSAEETARDVREILTRRRAFARPGSRAVRAFYTTGDDVEEFACFGSRVLDTPMDKVEHLDLPPIAHWVGCDERAARMEAAAQADGEGGAA